VRYAVPPDVRAIPNHQWETWLESDSVPWTSFSATPDCQMTLRHVVKATVRRMEYR
jgi:hypothetical protein